MKLLLLVVCLLAFGVSCEDSLDQERIANQNQLNEYLKVAKNVRVREGKVSADSLAREFRRIQLPVADYWNNAVRMEVDGNCVKFTSNAPGGDQVAAQCFEAQ
jgi:hypothetical protein